MGAFADFGHSVRSNPLLTQGLRAAVGRNQKMEPRITLLQKTLYILSILVEIVFYKDAQDRQDK